MDLAAASEWQQAPLRELQGALGPGEGVSQPEDGKTT